MYDNATSLRIDGDNTSNLSQRIYYDVCDGQWLGLDELEIKQP